MKFYHFPLFQSGHIFGGQAIAPTLRYYFNKSIKESDGPDLHFLREIVKRVGDKSHIVMEGRVYTPEQAIHCLYLGAYAVVVGNAITRPHVTAKKFVDALNKFDGE